MDESQPALSVWAGLVRLPPPGVDDTRPPHSALREVRSAVEVDAPPLLVWQRVLAFPPLVEPITHWEPGVRLAFDVTAQPKALQEWSPYAHVSVPHLDGHFASRRGEFRLVALPDGRTRLEGSTWHDMRLEPAAYWALIGDVIIAAIHARVLEHVRDVAEADARAVRAGA